MVFKVPFLCYFQKLQLLVVKKFWTNFCFIVLLYLWAQEVCLRFLRSNFKLEILMFLFFVVSFLVDKNLLFWWKKHQRWNLRHTFVEKLSKFSMAKVLKENSIICRSWSSAKLFIVQYTENANGYVPLTVVNVWHF